MPRARTRTPRTSRESPMRSTPVSSRSPRTRRASSKQAEMDLNAAAALKEKELKRARRVESQGRTSPPEVYSVSDLVCGIERRAACEKEKRT